MKKITCLWIVVMLLFVMTGCGVANVANPDTEDRVTEDTKTEATEDSGIEELVTDDSETEEPEMPSEETDSENIFRVKEFTLQLPDQWIGNYIVDIHEEEGKTFFVTFSAAKCYKETKQGWLFSIARYDNTDYTVLPFYEVIKEQDGVTYIVDYPTDVQTEMTSDAAKAQYYDLEKGIDDIVNSFQLTEN